MVRIGIDPGKNGFICVFNSLNGWFSFYPIPLIGKEIDIHELNKTFLLIAEMDDEDMHCAIEEVHSIFGASSKSTFSFGFGCGLLEGFLSAYNISYSKINPKKWQKEMFEGVALQQKPSSTGKTMKTDTKSMAEIAAKRLFPNIDLRATERSKKAHDGKVDALLLAEYCRRKF